MDIKSKAISHYDDVSNKYVALLENMFAESKPLNDDISEMLALESSYQQRYAQICSMAPPQLTFDGASAINQEYAEQIASYETHKQVLEAQYQEKLKNLNKEHTDAVTAATEKATAGVRPLIEKHKRLISYKDKVEDICMRYSISPTDIQIVSDINAKEYDALLDAAISGCESMIKQRSSKFNPLNLLYNPLNWEGQIEKQLIAIIAFCVLFRFFGGIIALIFFGGMIASTVGVYKKLDKLKIAEAMMYTPDFDKFMQRDEIDSIADVDTKEIDEWKEYELAQIEETNPAEARSKDMAAYASSMVDIDEHAKQCSSRMTEEHTKAKERASEELAAVTAHKEELISKMKKFGDSMLEEKPRCAPTYKYVLGRVNPVIEQAVEVPYSNYVFAPSPEMSSFLKLMLANALLSIKEKHLIVTIVDPDGLGRDFAEFLQQEKDTREYIKVCVDKIEDVLSNMRKVMTDNIRICGKRTLDDINREAEEKGMVTKDYNLIIFYSGITDSLKKPEYSELFETSYRYGVFLWLYSASAHKGMHVFSKPFDLPDIKQPHAYDYNLGAKCVETFAEAVRNSKDGSIDYFSSIQEKYIPREKWGTWSTNKGIELNFGLADGDPSKGYPMVLGDANVHLLMAGQSGAGKSAAINQMLLSLITKYSPNELMLVMIDFKNVEFSTFTVPDEKTGGKLSIIPHARIMAGTKDGEYALSIFDFLIAEMENRQKLFGGVNQKKLEDYNNLMCEQGHPERCLPRILLLIDEFQVMFTEVDKKIVDIIQDRIRSLAKLARAFGCHMWFTSQSMSGTMSADVKANFSMRAALRCTRDVSSEIIGNPAAGTIKAKFGYLYTNDSTGQDPTRNTLWRVPFVSTKNILKTMNEAAELYKSQGIVGYQSEFYDEDQMHSAKELFDFYKENKDLESIQNPHLFVLGRRTNFSTNNAPVNFYLEKGDHNNILIGGMEDSDMLNLCRTVMDNCEAHGLKYIISCADEDAHQLLELDTRLKGPFLRWSYPNVPFSDWIDESKSPIIQLVEKRLNNPEAITGPVYVILYSWDKYPGFGVAEDRHIDVMKDYMRLAPTVDVHFVLMLRAKCEIPTSFYSLYKHKIVALCDDALSYKILDNAKGSKLNPKGGFAIYMRGKTEYKFKIYQHEFSRKLAAKELTL